MKRSSSKLLPNFFRPFLEALEDRLLPAVITPFQPRFSVNTAGDIALIANTLLQDASGNGNSTPNVSNNNVSMQLLDIDADSTTFNSSEATLDLPLTASSILFAGLYWGADSSSASRTTVKFATAANVTTYQEITGTLIGNSGDNYQAFADVTALVQAAGEGAYRVANVQTGTGTNQYAGWSLLVVYADESVSTRNLTVFDGYARVANSTGNREVDVSLSGFQTPISGPVNVSLGFVSYEGDGGFTGDALKIDGNTLSTTVRPANNFFNSTISFNDSLVTTKIPDFSNQLGFDAGIIQQPGLLGNNATSTTLTFTTGGEAYFPGVLTTSIDLFAPELNANLTVEDINGGDLRAGDILEYTIELENVGLDAATDLILTNPIPDFTSFLSGSLFIDGIPQSDALNDDQADFLDGLNQLVFRLGAGANTSQGGTLAINGTTTITFQARVDPNSGIGTQIINNATVSYTGLSTAIDFDSPLSTLTSVVDQINNPPVLVPDTIIVNEGETTELDLVSNDFDPDGDPLFISEFTQALSGIVAQIDPTTLTFTPNNGFFGPDSFTYTISDSQGSTATDIVNLDVNALPRANPDTFSVGGRVSTFLPVVNDDFDPDGDPLTLVGVTPASGGSVALTTNNGLIYTPSNSFFGTDTFDYVLSDGRGGFSTGTITLDVNLPFAPRAVGDSFSIRNTGQAIQLDVLANDIAPPNTSITITDVSAQRGTITISPDGQSVFYQGPLGFTGSETLSYTITDDLGRTSTASISLEVLPGQDGLTGQTAVALTSSSSTLQSLATDKGAETVSSLPEGETVAFPKSILKGNLDTGATEGSNTEEGLNERSQISGNVFMDDGDGTRDEAEEGVAKKTVILEKKSDNVWVEFRTAITDLNGNYSFENLEPGDYRVKFSSTKNEAISAPFTGLYEINLKPGVHQKNQIFGIVPLNIGPEQSRENPESASQSESVFDSKILDNLFQADSTRSEITNYAPLLVDTSPKSGSFDALTLWVAGLAGFALQHEKSRHSLKATL